MLPRTICVLRGGHRWRLVKQGVKQCKCCGIFHSAAL